MDKVVIVVEPAGAIDPPSEVSPAYLQLISRFKESILANATDAGMEIPVVAASELEEADCDPSLILPLTLDLPDRVEFEGKSVFQACRDLAALQQQVKAWGYAIGSGDLWLPIVLTARGPLYAEAIGRSSPTAAQAPEVAPYVQPVHLPDLWRQPLYALGHRLLQHLQAPAAVYLLQFSLQSGELCFDRLIPFPDLPTLASVGVQSPDLLLCHWLCVTGQPITDLIVRSSISASWRK